jgi:ABC-type hemin transport system substrate-binding protein
MGQRAKSIAVSVAEEAAALFGASVATEPVSQCDSDTPDPIAVEVDRQAQRPLLAVTQAARMQECERLAKHILTRFGSEKPDILEVARQLRNWRYGGR